MDPQFDGAEYEYTRYPAARAASEYAFYYGSFSVALTVLPLLLRIPMDHWALRIFSFIAMIVALVLMLRHYRDKRNGGILTLGQGMAISVLTGLFSGIVIALFSYILFQFLVPDLIDQMKEQIAERLYERGLDSAQIASQMDMLSFFMSPAYIAVSGFLFSVFLFAFFGLIVSATMKREPQ